MEHSVEVEPWRSAAKRALDAQDALLNAWRRQDEIGMPAYVTAEDVELLRKLIRQGIYPLNAFELLAKVEQSAAIDVLLNCYLGDGVDPDTKFGGYTSELSIMLDDLKEAHGISALRSLVRNPRLRQDLLKDPRVIEAFGRALDIFDEDVRSWLAQ